MQQMNDKSYPTNELRQVFPSISTISSSVPWQNPYVAWTGSQVQLPEYGCTNEWAENRNSLL